MSVEPKFTLKQTNGRYAPSAVEGAHVADPSISFPASAIPPELTTERGSFTGSFRGFLQCVGASIQF